jgi:hypothetical protein
MKHSINMGKQVYQIRDIKIDSFAMGEQKFKMDSRIYSYKLTVYKHKDGEEHILRINNINNSNDERIFGAQVYSGAVTNNLIKTKYNDFSAIHTGCYSD